MRRQQIPQQSDLYLKIADARALAIKAYPYLSPALMSLRILSYPSPIETMAIDDGWRIYWSAEFVAECSLSELAWVLLHEVWHVLREHGARKRTLEASRGKVDHLVWNAAADMEINDDLMQTPFSPPEGIILPGTFNLPEHKTAEEYYDMLIQQAQQRQARSKTQALYGEQGEGSGVTGEKTGDEEKGTEEAIEGGTGHRELPPNDPDHPAINDAVKETIKRNVAEQIRRAAQAGNVPGGWDRWAEEILKPKVDWKRELGSVIAQRIDRWRRGHTEYTYMRPSRRRQIQTPKYEIYSPSRVSPSPKVAVIIDTSGSIDKNDLARALGEVWGIIRQLGTKVIAVVADAAVQNVQEISDPSQLRLVGGGGTDMGLALDYVREHIKPSVAVVLTDGETPWNVGSVPPFPVIVALLRQTTIPVPSWVSKVIPLYEHYEQQEKQVT